MIFLTSILFLVFIIYIVSKWKYSYWKRKKVPHLAPSPLLGNYGEYFLLKKTFGEATQTLCKEFPNAPYFGAYYGTEPALVVQDLELIKLIMAKDFYYFNSREVAAFTHKELTTRNLFFIYGDQWKLMRHSMTPSFTPAKMKKMYYLIQKCIKDFQNTLEYETKKSKELDALFILARYTMDCIGTTAFGVETNTLARDVSKNPFSAIGDIMFEISWTRAYAYIIRGIWPSVFYKFGFKVFPEMVHDFFYDLVTDVFESRNYRPSSRNDFVDNVLNLKEKDYITCENWSQAASKEPIKMKVDNDLLISQCQVIFAAGFETTALTMNFTLFELAKDERIQTKVLEEVDNFVSKYGEELEHDSLIELSYLEACIDEAMRLYPALGTITREVVHDYILPSGLRLKKGLRIQVPVYHLHRNPEYFPNPDEFKPERFLAGEKERIQPYTYMPFGEGSRICIGRRLAKILTITGLMTVLRKYRVELGSGMSRNMVLEPKAMVTRPSVPVKLKFIERN